MNLLTHAMLGWLVARPLDARRDRGLVTAAAILPDLDGLAVLGGIDRYEAWHHTVGHAPLAALALSALALVPARNRGQLFPRFLASYLLHLACDFAGSGPGWGIPWLWPFDPRAYESAPPLLWGLQSWQNYAVSIAAMIAIARTGVRTGRTIVELASPAADRHVVDTFRKWFGPPQVTAVVALAGSRGAPGMRRPQDPPAPAA